MSATRTRSCASTFGADMRRLAYGFVAAAFVIATPLAQRLSDNPHEILDRAIDDFLGGHLAESVTGFDRVATLVPQVAPQLWQRGIALYYAGRYQDCRAQFESHRIVNPNDVENPAWHYLCVAKAESPAKARAALLPVVSISDRRCARSRRCSAAP
jgi:lipoprotein NlpI